MIHTLVDNHYKYCISVSGKVLQEVFSKGIKKSVTDGRTHCAKFKDYLCVTTESRKKVSIITNIFNVEPCKELKKINSRKVLTFYDDHKRKADQFNQLYIHYLSSHKHKEFEATVLSSFIMMIITNAFLVFQELEDNSLNHKQFLLSISEDLILHNIN